MVAVVVALAVVVVLLGILVAGLLRSHADILRSLHALGGGVGDPAMAHEQMPTSSMPLHIGPSLPPERDATSSFPVAGVTPSGDALAVTVSGSGQFTLLAFLSSGCRTCRGFWQAFRSTTEAELPDGVRPVIVTKGPELEERQQVAALAPTGIPVVMSTKAWGDYEIPGAPFFVLVDTAGRRVGEGMATQLHQVADLVRRGLVDTVPTADRRGSPRLDGPGREADNDAALRRAGILPGDASLYPRMLADVMEDTTAEGVRTA